MSFGKLLLALCLTLALLTPSALAQKPLVIGILPVFDVSPEPLNKNLTPNLTYMLYRDMLNNPAYQPILLTPGGLYDPDATDWIAEYAVKAKVDLVLIATLRPTVKKNDRTRYITIDVRLLNAADGSVTPRTVSEQAEAPTRDLFSAILISDNYYSDAAPVSTPQPLGRPHPFEKQPLGKSARKLVDWTESYLAATLPAIKATPTGTEPLPDASCAISFSVRYAARKSIAKSYSVLADDMDESSTIRDGYARFTVPNGPLALRVQVNDAPYGMRTEKLYQASTILDCARGQRNLSLDLNNGGDALLNWR